MKRFCCVSEAFGGKVQPNVSGDCKAVRLPFSIRVKSGQYIADAVFPSPCDWVYIGVEKEQC